jgi:NADPH-dependent glutamate synthase beta subunit-like oxidoreductase
MNIAIIGSGPAGCYLADQLLRTAPTAQVDVIDRLPVPFGLVRYGVAPDHQSTKAVARILDRVLSHKQVSFFGNVDVGRDVSLGELLSFYDAVVLATGATRDKKLGIPGEELPGVIGSGKFVAWYNGHPDSSAPKLQNVKSVVVIGNGNVAIDVARVLAKETAELVGSDLSPEVTEQLAAQPIETIHIVGRRGASDAKFTQHELAELGTLKRAHPHVVDPAQLSGDSQLIKILTTFNSDVRNGATPITINFHFGMTPVAFVGSERLEFVRFRHSDGSEREIAANLAVTCIGYESLPCCAESPVKGVFPNEDGKIRDRLYVVGWAKRGPSGVIASSRADAQVVAQKISKEVIAANRPGREALRQHLFQRGVHVVDHAGWKRINAAETAEANEQRCRTKFTSKSRMLEIAKEMSAQ